MNVLIFGYGHMGKIHARHLSDRNIKFDYYDPFFKKTDLDLDDFTHFIISSPPDCHINNYKLIKQHPGPKLIEKPVVVSSEHFFVFDDLTVFSGMIERFNPAIIELLRHLKKEDVNSLEFFRYGPASDILFDFAIHDLDLFVYILGIESVPKIENKRCISYDGVQGIFNWGIQDERSRYVIIKTKKGIWHVDLIEQKIIVNGVPIQVEKSFPIEAEHDAFFAGKTCRARICHHLLNELCLK